MSPDSNVRRAGAHLPNGSKSPSRPSGSLTRPKSVSARRPLRPRVAPAEHAGPASWIQAVPGSHRSGVNVSRADRRLARGLAWFSLGLGIPQVVMPGRVNRIAGLENTFRRRQLMRLMGLREISAGVGILNSQPKPTEWLWARVGGDALDLTLLGTAFRNPSNNRSRLAIATANVAAVTAADLVAAGKTTKARNDSGEDTGLKGRTSITVNRPPEEVYRYWHDFTNLPKFMFHLEKVEPKGDKRYHWVAKAPLGRKVEWDAEITEEIPNELIAWRSSEDAEVPNSGSVEFSPAPGDRGTEIVVEVDYQLPGGAIGDAVAQLFGEEPQQQIKDDLRRFKQVVETGEVVRSEGSPEGTAATPHELKQRPAQPLP
jgi:uncharacterized membrane protein